MHQFVHQVPDKCWKQVSVDLFGPMPSLKRCGCPRSYTRFPSSKKLPPLPKLTMLSHHWQIFTKTLEILQTKMSDNGPLFNAETMSVFAQKDPLHHPQAKPEAKRRGVYIWLH